MTDQQNTQLIDSWEYSSCPVSTNNLARDAKGNNWATWETAGKIYTTILKDGNIKASLVREPKQDIRQKHPTSAFNNAGYKTVVWSEGNGYFSGESMFYTESNASKFALVALAEALKSVNIDFIDCQLLNPFLESMGAIEISREQFVLLKNIAINSHINDEFWQKRELFI